MGTRADRAGSKRHVRPLHERGRAGGRKALNVAVVIVAYNQPGWTAKLVETATSSRHDITSHLFLHSTDPRTVEACETLSRRDDLIVDAHGCNRGLSLSWNDGVLQAYDQGAEVVIVANDDICFSPGDLDRIAERAARNRDRYIVSCAGYHLRLRCLVPSHGFSCFALNPIALDTIGCFDENFFPAYCEDQDYSRRAALAGLHEENCADTMVYHGGSSAIFTSLELRERNAVTQARNMDYYRQKWGGDGGSERFAAPFDNPALPFKIPREQRHAPYGPGYDRTDRDLLDR